MLEFNPNAKLGLDRVARYIKDNVGPQDWEEHAKSCSGYVAAALGITEKVTVAYLLQALGLV